MTIVEGVDKIISHRVTKKIGYSQGFGSCHFGYTLFGHSDDFSGIYHRYNQYGKTHFRKMAFYWPRNPRTVPQQARRTLFAAGVSTWQTLTGDQKDAYNKLARPRSMSGFNFFMREYLNA